ncbi:MAG: tRNA pseudouridine(13) synthase TruD [Phycisphaeraceae bacterium]|nr:tRNA pseudouridine(13) synthase TruD [Phycisphaeraceae bacterium]
MPHDARDSTPPNASAPDPHIVPAAYITADVPPIGGVIKQRPEDFLVEETPLYQPSGQGEHIYLFVEKRGLSTLEMVEIIARHFRVDRRAVGYAGMKDKPAITRQVVSVHVPGRKIEDFPSLEHDRVGVLWADYHTNKLRTGHLGGNRFSIRIRSVPATAALPAKRVLDRLERTGVPNRFGEQRFGHCANNHLVGRAILLGDPPGALDHLLAPCPDHPEQQPEGRALYAQGRFAEAIDAFPRSLRTERNALGMLARGVPPDRILARLDDRVRKFMLSAFQSAVFNAVLDARVLDGSFGTLRLGCIAHIHATRGQFHVTPDVFAEPDLADRAARLELSPTGPMWGVSMRRCDGASGDLERRCLEAAGVSTEDLDRYAARPASRGSHDIEGARRPLRVPVIAPQVEGGVDEHGSYVRVAFELERGAFATVVLREIMKPASGASIESEAG